MRALGRTIFATTIYYQTNTRSLPQPLEPTPQSQTRSQTRFSVPVSEEELLQKVQAAVPRNTRNATSWAHAVWTDWIAGRQSASGADFPVPLQGISNEQLSYWMPRFVVEARNQKGKQYTPTSLYALCVGIQRFVRESRIKTNKLPVDIFKDPAFALFRSVFDSTLKDLHSQGVGTTKKQAQVISEDLEESLWEENVLGEDTPKKLLDTMVYLLGVNFALRSGKEHRSLRTDMFKVVENPICKPYLVYTETGSKNNSGGLHHRTVKNKVVKAFVNIENPSRCIVRLFKKYVNLRPTDAPHAFYLQPLKHPREDCWYNKKVVGHNSLLRRLLKRLAQQDIIRITL